MAGSSQLPSLKATIGYSGALAGADSAVSLRSVISAGAQPLDSISVDETIDAASLTGGSGAALPSSVRSGDTTAARTTVLPRRRSKQAPGAPELRPRFDRVRVLGQGGMGEVELARDNDIRRTVAVKRLRADVQSEEALHRFADEVRIVGQLEHPAIVPVYDVGRDEVGQVYLVMKHLNGETMEDIIDKLRAKDPAYVEKYTHEYRMRLFLSVLDAIRYAHARGVIHRDLKPANIMIGPYGEVTVLDWGIAKPISKKSPDAANDAGPLERTLVEPHSRVGDVTQFGSLAGTPLYMSPEQAAGRNDELDERSDVYSLCVLLYEWLSLEHPLSHKKTVSEVLAAIISEDYTTSHLFEHSGGMPMEYLRVIRNGLVRDRDLRPQSVADLENEIQRVLDGNVRVACHFTLAKHCAHAGLHWIDRHPKAYTIIFFSAVLGGIAALGLEAFRLVHGM